MDKSTDMLLDEIWKYIKENKMPTEVNTKEDAAVLSKQELSVDEISEENLLKALEEIAEGGYSIPEVPEKYELTQEWKWNPDNDAVTEYDPDSDLEDLSYDELVSEAEQKYFATKGNLENEEKPKTKTFKADKMANGFMYQANPLSEDSEPFYMEAYLLGANEFYISGGMSGTLNMQEMKQLRQSIKFLMNQMDESYPDTEKKKGGKAVLKLDAPWLPTDAQVAKVQEIVAKQINKIEKGDLNESNIIEAATDAAVTAISQVVYEKFTENDTEE